MALFCPRCGSAISAEPIEIGRWRLSPGMARFDGLKLPLSPCEATVLHVLASAGGDIVAPASLGAAFASSDQTKDTVRVLVRRIRMKLGADCPVETVRGHGYRWGDVPASPYRPPLEMRALSESAAEACA